jgi:hypothetical protein
MNMSVDSKGSGGFMGKQDPLLLKLKQQEKLKELNHMDVLKYKIEAEGDGGQIQQISGGFGDSTNIDEETIKALARQHEEA